MTTCLSLPRKTSPASRCCDLASTINHQLEGRESSNDERGARNGDDDRDPRLNTAAAAATGNDDDVELDVVVEYGSFDEDTVS